MEGGDACLSDSLCEYTWYRMGGLAVEQVKNLTKGRFIAMHTAINNVDENRWKIYTLIWNGMLTSAAFFTWYTSPLYYQLYRMGSRSKTHCTDILNEQMNRNY